MSERKMWKEEEDNMINDIVKQNSYSKGCLQLKWSQVAEILQKRISGCIRTGKQCRQRWFNHLNPEIIKDKQLTKIEIDRLFQLQDNLGNKWSNIAQEFKGRTDNYLKNFFYSSLRRAIRQINHYLANYKKKCNIKPFKQTILTKILKIKDQKYRQKLDIKSKQADELAKEIKNMLSKLSFEEQNKKLNDEEKDFREKIVKNIQQFNKNCKKRKQKKVEEDEQQFQSKRCHHHQNQSHVNSSQQQKKKTKRKPRIKKTTQKQIKTITKTKTKNSQKKNKANTQILQIKQQDCLYHSPSKHEQSPQDLFANHIIDQIDINTDNKKQKRKKSLIDDLQQQNYQKSPTHENKKCCFKQPTKNQPNDFFSKSDLSCIDNYQPLRFLGRKSSHEDINKDQGQLYGIETWKKNQNKGEVSLFQNLFTHDLDPSLLESINIGDTFPKIENSINQSSIFENIWKNYHKTEQGNIS